MAAKIISPLRHLHPHTNLSSTGEAPTTTHPLPCSFRRRTTRTTLSSTVCPASSAKTTVGSLVGVLSPAHSMPPSSPDRMHAGRAQRSAISSSFSIIPAPSGSYLTTDALPTPPLSAATQAPLTRPPMAKSDPPHHSIASTSSPPRPSRRSPSHARPRMCEFTLPTLCLAGIPHPHRRTEFHIHLARMRVTTKAHHLRSHRPSHPTPPVYRRFPDLLHKHAASHHHRPRKEPPPPPSSARRPSNPTPPPSSVKLRPELRSPAPPNSTLHRMSASSCHLDSPIPLLVGATIVPSAARVFLFLPHLPLGGPTSHLCPIAPPPRRPIDVNYPPFGSFGDRTPLHTLDLHQPTGDPHRANPASPIMTSPHLRHANPSHPHSPVTTSIPCLSPRSVPPPISTRSTHRARARVFPRPSQVPAGATAISPCRRQRRHSV